MSHWPGLFAPNSPIPVQGPLNLPMRSSSLTHTSCSTLACPTTLASTLKVGHALSFLVATVQHAGNRMIITAPTCLTATEQVTCAHPYSPCCYFIPTNRSATFFRKKPICLRHCIRWADLFLKDKTDAKIRAAIPGWWHWHGTQQPLLSISVFSCSEEMLDLETISPWKTSLCCAPRITLNGDNTSGYIKQASSLHASTVPLLETHSERILLPSP